MRITGRHHDLSDTIRSCRRLVDTLDLPPSHDIHEMCRHVAARRGRPVHVLPMALDTSDPSGLWLLLDDADFIVHEELTSRRHQAHIVAHELGHMLCGHRNAHQDAHTFRIFPDLDPALVRDLLFRTGYSSTQEREAEIMAFLLLERIHAANAERSSAHPSPDPVVQRIRRSLAGTITRP